VPIIDVGFVYGVRRGVIEVVPGVIALDGRTVVLADGSRVHPDAIVAATGYDPGLEPLVGHVTAIGDHGIPIPQPRLHFLRIGVLLSGLLHQVANDARQMAGKVARELASSKPRRRDDLGTG
jgi:putative flavoprotein involved in K+ transport